MLGICLAPRVSDGRRQWRLPGGQLLGQQRCNSTGSLEDREEGMEVEGRGCARSLILESNGQRQEGDCSSEKRAREHKLMLAGFLEEVGQAGCSLPAATSGQGQGEGPVHAGFLPLSLGCFI